MSTVLVKDCYPSEVGDSDTYNRLQMRRAIQTRGDPTKETLIGAPGELLRVLIVDDHRAAADTLSMLVGIWGHDVRRAYDGTTGLALAAAYQPDVVLLDILMPNVDGLELARQVRQQTRLNHCFIIAVTGCTDAGHRRQCEEAGIDLFLIKPVTPSILKALLVWEFEYVLRSRHDTARFDAAELAWSETVAFPRSARNHRFTNRPEDIRRVIGHTEARQGPSKDESQDASRN